ncbi:MAG: nucleotidyltransferase domain-containing protein [Alphaproteobacteria bacterium]|nr:nucleotidyltransferase domain-containing protein [Alphaproteobacteria bacterium]MBY0502024.1 nucleotidyltransferase domain-containing protein [Alphaproteobacteria bacterium]
MRIFSSRAKGTATRRSDLDLAIDTNIPLTSKEKTRLKDAFYEYTLHYKVDIVDMRNVSATFCPYIVQGGGGGGGGVLGWEKKCLI